MSPLPHPPGQHSDKIEKLEARYRQLVESVRDYAIFLLDPVGMVLTWNPGAQAIKGYTAEEIVGRPFSTFYTEEDRRAGKPERLLAIASREGRVEDEGWRVRKDGSRFWADVVLTAIHDDDGRLTGFSKVTRDLSTRRQSEESLRQSEERFRVLVQSVKDTAIFMLDPLGRVATWNAGAERIKGYEPHEILGLHFSTFYPPEERTSGKAERELETAKREGKFEEEAWRVRKDGSRFWANVVLEPLRDSDGHLLGFAKVTRDLTERKAADAERLRLAHAQEAIRLRDEFLSIASHELKTPITAMRLQLQSLLRDVAENSRQHTKATKAYRGLLRLSELVEALLDVSRIATGKLTLTPVALDLSELAAEVVERFQDQALHARAKLSLSSPSPIQGKWDRLRIEQVLSNLIANALRYAAGSEIKVDIRGERGEAVLEVSDGGPGIAAAERQRIFERFERAASPQHFGGLGLGLYVAKQIVEAHHGSIAVEDVQPTGARFRIRLPLALNS